MSGLMAVFRKELADHFSSKRFIILSLLIYFAGIATIYVAAQNIRSEVTETTQFIFLRLFTAGGEITSFLFFVCLLLPIVGIALGFDAINSERMSGNLSRLLSQPLYRDSVINGKFLAGLFTLAILVVSIVAIVAGLGLRMIGVPPSAEEVLRLFAFIFVSIIYGAFWMALAVLFSVFFNRVATSVLASIGLWFFIFIFLLFGIAGPIADGIIPIDQNSTQQLLMRHYELQTMINRGSPIFLYQEAVVVLLLPRTMAGFGVLPVDLPFPLSFGQSLLLVWPQITSLIALTALCFAVSYTKFMREEIRST
ncbi:MAG: ABC transporter permease [Dehalococcoidia bacterium]|nr:ABC transporter permease [Dehalococcoidia bacterium]